MPNIIEANSKSDTSGIFIGIVVARYNESITRKLLDGALETLEQRGVVSEKIDVAWVPGAWEIPVIAKQMAASSKYDAVLTFGAVIRGETSHDQHINAQVSQSLGALALEYQMPVVFGVLTVNSLEQAIHRSGGNQGNKGVECAEAALEMMDVMTQLRVELGDTNATS